MSFPIFVPSLDQHPPLHRSRSQTIPSQSTGSAEEPQTASLRPTRPPHVRSQSYLSPTEPKPRNAITLPATTAIEKTAEKLPRIHIPGTGHRHHHSQESHHKKGRHSQSEAFPPKHANTSLPHLVAGLNAEREKRVQALHGGPAAPSVPSRSYLNVPPAFGPGNAVPADYTEGGRYDLRRRATSDPNRPPLRTQTSVEKALERAEKVQYVKRLSLTTQDVAQKDKEIEEAEEEMRERVAEINRVAVEISRRLDYGYYNLLEKVGNLVGTIQSFQSLSQQSKQLISNFETETHKLDQDTRRKIRDFKNGYHDREIRAQALEKRGRSAARKAEELGRRLENARIIVENWENREDQVKRVRDRVWGAICWTTIVFLCLIMAIIVGREWWIRGDLGSRVRGVGDHNASLALPDVPDDVRRLLESIAERHRDRKGVFSTPGEVTNEKENPSDVTLRLFDEL